MALPTPAADRTCLVTGASSGIGIEIARAWARRGHGVTLVARRKERLEEVARQLADEHGVRCEVIAADLADEASRDRLAEELEALGLQVRILCNNAGYGTGGRFDRLDRHAEIGMVRLNCEAVVDLCGRYVPAMVREGCGGILNTVSTAGYQPLPRQATYAATKALALSFTEALHQELRPAGIHVTALCPGPAKTAFMDMPGIREAADSAPAFLFEPVEEVAERGVRGLERNRRVVVVGPINKLTALSGHYAPRGLALPALDRFYPVGRD
jgi:short-subunit dehydrogenase